MKVRNATVEDIPRIVEMAQRFYATTNYVWSIPVDVPTANDLTFMLIDSGVMLVAEHEGTLVGMVGLAVVGFMFNRNVKTAHEVIWWVEPEHRKTGAGRDLLNAVEPACRARGAKTIQMMHLPNSPAEVALVYKSMGYSHSETSFTKEIR